MAAILAALIALAVAATVAVAKPGAGSSEPGSKTARPAYLIPQPGSGVVVDPILSAGDIIGEYQMSGIPDGLGA